MKLKDEDTDSPKYCKQITDWDFNLQEGKVRIDLEDFTNCNETDNDSDTESFQCVDWEETEMSISLHLDECHGNLERLALPELLDKIYKNTCHENNNTCIWRKVEYEKNPGDTLGSSNPFHNISQCIEKNSSIPSAQIHLNKIRPLKATKATGTISTREEEATDMIFLSDSQHNLECLMKEFEIQSLGKE